MSLMSDPTLRDANKYARAFAEATPFRHVAIDGFLDAQFCQRLLDDFPGFEDRYALNEMGKVGGKAVRMNVRDISASYRSLDDFLQTREFLDYVSRVTGIPELLYDADYVGGGTHENRDGQCLDAHVDFNYHPRTQTHRRLNLIVYLNHEWRPEWGGELQLHSDPWDSVRDEVTSISPLFNRAVVFDTNEISWHGFSPICLPAERRSLSRKSFAIYLYTKARPAAETAPPHATIYVPEAMPSDIVEGKVIDSSDLSRLRQRFAGLRAQLRFLYEREKQFGAQIGSVEKALSESRAAFRAPVQGYATQDAAPIGMFEDLWLGKECRLRLTPARAVTAIELDVWAPGQLDADQVLHVEILGTTWTHHVSRGTRSPAKLRIRAAAGEAIDIHVSAERSFVPSAQNPASGDNRDLSLRLLQIVLTH